LLRNSERAAMTPPKVEGGSRAASAKESGEISPGDLIRTLPDAHADRHQQEPAFKRVDYRSAKVARVSKRKSKDTRYDSPIPPAHPRLEYSRLDSFF